MKVFYGVVWCHKIKSVVEVKIILDPHKVKFAYFVYVVLNLVQRLASTILSWVDASVKCDFQVSEVILKVASN